MFIKPTWRIQLIQRSEWTRVEVQETSINYVASLDSMAVNINIKKKKNKNDAMIKHV